MKRILALALTLILAGLIVTESVAQTVVIQAQVKAELAAERVLPQPPAHSQLTPKEVAEGWIALFDGETTFGWHSPNGSKWTLVEGMLAPQAEKPGLLVSTTAFRDCELKLQYRIRRGSKVEVRVGCNSEGKADPTGTNHLQAYGDGWFETLVHVRNSRVVNSETYSLGGGPRTATAVKESRNTKEEPSNPAGHIALSGNEVIFRSIKLQPVNTKPLFNGKDLTGWKKYESDVKRAKSTFAVSPEGWLTIKDGPGDLQTEGQWADFLLQIECKTNGKNLNSGVFFRCRPGEYQNGYEAQIHNGWGETPKEYLVDEYDPKTHELKEKKKVQSLALDYGTGAIYRRIPARKAVAKDDEWFTMTVLAQGNHLATWVNGVQVVDWTDNRPLADNARNGCHLEKGPISLQGHDPTTNLAFRNIRIADLTTTKREEPRPEKKD